MPSLSLPLAGESQAEPQIRVYEGDILQDVFRIGTIKKAEKISGGLSSPSKMPEWSYDIPATRCKIGSVLAGVDNSVCSGCYALKGRYHSNTVQQALERRFQALGDPLWVPALVLLIQRRRVQYFRWHSSGDFQSIEHLQNVNLVAQFTPETRHWGPSRERLIIQQTKRRIGQFARNFRIRLSGTMVDGPAPKGWPTTSTVFTEEPREGSFRCPASGQGGICGNCRACWGDEPDVAYPKH